MEQLYNKPVHIAVLGYLCRSSGVEVPREGVPRDASSGGYDQACIGFGGVEKRAGFVGGSSNVATFARSVDTVEGRGSDVGCPEQYVDGRGRPRQDRAVVALLSAATFCGRCEPVHVSGPAVWGFPAVVRRP